MFDGFPLFITLTLLFLCGDFNARLFKCHSKNWQLCSIHLLDLGIIKSLEDVSDQNYFEVRPPILYDYLSGPLCDRHHGCAQTVKVEEYQDKIIDKSIFPTQIWIFKNLYHYLKFNASQHDVPFLAGCAMRYG